ncbi:MAG: CoB--CoM heterodisulfide reductase iron-sulfur subunit B family protein [candidate division Zixibacteria bacterium]|nr:CoB--CoM heterodisulfide reductase iron-sulfur subunit B family protein [candidate division Zixibacteria bacterium]
MNYLYYPGCSSSSTGRPYEESLLEVFKKLDVPVSELEDWNCCGATAYMAISELKAFALCARNFALAERQSESTGATDMMVPCAACYLGLNKAQRYLHDHAEIREKVKDALDAAGLEYQGRVRVRHPLDIIVNDIGIDRVTSLVSRPLEGYRVACYYGCQIIRPYADFDDQHNPTSMERIIKALGAEVVDWPLKTRCCGGSLTGTAQDLGLRLSKMLLDEASRRGCNVVATACPLCQFNLECYQPQISRRFGKTVDVPVAFFTQLMGMAFGLGRRELGLQRLFVPLRDPSREKVAAGGSHVTK